MPYSRPLSAALLSLLLAACGVAETAPPPVGAAPMPAPEPVVALPAEPTPREVEPEPTLQERWGAPFAVRSSGRPAERTARKVVVLQAEAATVAAAPDPDPTPAPASAAPDPAPDRAPAAPAAARSGPRRATAAERTHRVEWGETWYGIARRYSVSPATLAAANPAVEPEKLRAGVALRVPASEPAEARKTRTHKVGPGDSLWGIARRYGVTADRIREANDLSGDRVRLGETLVIPPGQ